MKRLVFAVFMFFCFIDCIFASSKFKVTLDKCIDGDTARFIINGESKTVRFLSINAPESAHDNVQAEPYGIEASDYTCDLLKNAKTIKLEYDPKSDKTDKYGRVLAWIFVDGELLQKKLVSEGLAEVKYVYDDYLYSNDLKSIEKDAKEANLGMWSNNSSKNSEIPNFYLIVFCFTILFCSFVFFKVKYYIRKKILIKKSRLK